MILRETQNRNDADDANDAESGIWYRDILKTASQASSASLSSRKNSAGVWGTPQKCACGWPHAMLAKHVCPKTMALKTQHQYKFVHFPEWIDSWFTKTFDSSVWINVWFTLITKAEIFRNLANTPGVNHIWFIQKSWLEKVNQFWFTLQLEIVLWNEEQSFVYGFSLCRTQ